MPHCIDSTAARPGSTAQARQGLTAYASAALLIEIRGDRFLVV